MDIQTVWLTGQLMEKKFSSLLAVKVVKQDSTSFLLCRLTAGLLKNFPSLMQSLGLILPMENRSLLYIVRRLAATGNVIVADGKQISIFSILPTMNQKRSALKQMLVMNSRCGMAIRFISYLTADQS